MSHRIYNMKDRMPIAALVITQRTSGTLAAFQRVASTPITPIAYDPIINIPADTTSLDAFFSHQHRSLSDFSNSKSMRSLTRDQGRPGKKIIDPLSDI